MPGFRSIGLCAAAIPATLVLLGCASLTRENTYGLAPTDAAFVRQTCTQTMGLRKGLEEFDACAQSLSDTVHRRIDEQRLDESHRACERQGYAAGTPQLAQCVVLAEKAKDEAHDAAISSTASAPTTARISFFSMDRNVQDEHEKLACAQLGLDPITGDFHDCVMGIKEAIFTAQNPLL
jgi:hypothetical protein